MANYFRLRADPDPKVVGVRDGGSQADIHRSGFRDKKLYDRIMGFLGSYDSWTRVQEEPNFDLELQYVRLRKSAKITDFLQFGPVLINCPFLVSDQARKVLLQFKLSNCRFYGSNLYTKENYILSYYLLFCRSLSYEVINFRNSIVYAGLDENEIILQIESLDEYNKYVANSNRIVQFHKYALNKNFDSTLDLFMLGSKIFVSEQLRNEILNAHLTGITLSPAFGENDSPTVELQK
jgi:hypothetical protein